MTVAVTRPDNLGLSNSGEAEMIIWYPEVNIYFMPLV
jgi:hypothetical protein